MREISGLSLGLCLLAAACAPSMTSDGEGGVGGKADGELAKLECAFTEGGADVKVRDKWTIEDLGPIDTWPEDLPWTYVSKVIGEGLQMRAYHVTGDLKIGRKAWQTIDAKFYGNLYATGGVINSEDNDVFEIDVRDDGEVVATVVIEQGHHQFAGFKCEGDLPTEEEARGPNPNGLALEFECLTEATEDAGGTKFRFAAIRIDSQQAISFGVLPGQEEWDNVVFPNQDTPLIVLTANTSIGRTARRIIIGGDGDGVDYGELRIGVPKAAGDTVTGKFYYEMPDDDVEWSVPVSCTTTAHEVK